MAIFLPVAFMRGVIGKFFFQFGVTMTVAVMLSLLEALTLPYGTWLVVALIVMLVVAERYQGEQPAPALVAADEKQDSGE